MPGVGIFDVLIVPIMDPLCAVTHLTAMEVCSHKIQLCSDTQVQDVDIDLSGRQELSEVLEDVALLMWFCYI